MLNLGTIKNTCVKTDFVTNYDFLFLKESKFVLCISIWIAWSELSELGFMYDWIPVKVWPEWSKVWLRRYCSIINSMEIILWKTVITDR